jgi:hypothetical protein
MTLLKDDSVRPSKDMLGLPTYSIANAKGELTGQEAVKLHEQLEVHIVTLWRLAVRGANVVGVEINT